MSDLQKPATVEIGQWWLWSYHKTPTRIEGTATSNGVLEAQYLYGHGYVACPYLLVNGTYLGNGEHPAPSEKMIETLAEHVADSVMVQSWNVLVDNDRSLVRLSIIAAITIGHVRAIDLPSVQMFQRCALSLYRILRARSEW